MCGTILLQLSTISWLRPGVSAVAGDPAQNPLARVGKVGASPRIGVDGCGTGNIDEPRGPVQHSQQAGGGTWEKSSSSKAGNWEKKACKGTGGECALLGRIHISPRVSTREWQTAISCNATKLIAPTA
jgi:hypothetical protein